jgi:hypothetical protein
MAWICARRADYAINLAVFANISAGTGFQITADALATLSMCHTPLPPPRYPNPEPLTESSPRRERRPADVRVRVEVMGLIIRRTD